MHIQANGYQIDFDHWHAAVHGTLPYKRMLHEDKPLRQLLASIDLPKYVFTNADIQHAETCLRLLGIADLFQVGPCTSTALARMSSYPVTCLSPLVMWESSHPIIQS